MANSWLSTSEIVAGLIIKGRISINAVRPNLFISPYDSLIELMQKGITSPEELIERIGLDPYSTCLHAADNLNGTGKANWIAILENSVAMYQAGTEMEKASKKLLRGDDIDWTKILSCARNAQEKMARNIVPLSEVESKEVPFIPSGWPILDEHLGGIPAVGLIVLGGITGTGKTTWMTRFAGSFAKYHKDKKVMIFSIEMILSELATRFRQVGTWGEAEERILLQEVPINADEAISISATIENLGLICIDFSDLMVEKDTTESEMAYIYRTLMKGAKTLHVPILLLCQLTYRDKMGIPRPSWLRYSSMAENLAWMILMLYDPAHSWQDIDDKQTKEDILPLIDDHAYILCWKCRGGFRKHLDDSPGAICVRYKRSKGWHPSEGKWYSLKRYS